MLWRDRLKVVFRSMRYPDAWRFGPRASLGMFRYLWNARPTWHAGVAELNLYSPPVGSPAYGRYLHGLRRLGRGEWLPMVAHLSVTDRCPYRCRRCSNLVPGATEPTLASLQRIFEQLRAAGTCRVALTGGEPLLREDLSEIVRICGAELSPVLFTSGYGLEAMQAKTLRCAGLAAVFVSLDHYLPEPHDRGRGQSGAFSRAIAAIQACRKAPLYTAVQAVATPSLLADGELDRFLGFCQNLGVHEIMLLEPVRVGNKAEEDPLPPGARAQLANLHRRSTRDARLPKISSMAWLESAACLGCQAGLSFLYISTRGDVFPCDFVPVSFGNLFEDGLEEIHARMVQFFQQPSSRCLACRLQTLYGEEARWPLGWDSLGTVLPNYDPGPLPSLMRSFCHASQHAQ